MAAMMEDVEDLMGKALIQVMPGPQGTKNIMVQYDAGYKVAPNDLILTPVDNEVYVDPDNPEASIQNVQPVCSSTFKTANSHNIFGIAYAVPNPGFQNEVSTATAIPTPTCTVLGTQGVLNLSGSVIPAFEKLTFGPIMNPPAKKREVEEWRQKSDATVTLRRSSPIVWRPDIGHLRMIVQEDDLFDLFKQHYRATCMYTLVPAILALYYRDEHVLDDGAQLRAALDANGFMAEINSEDYKAQAQEAAAIANIWAKINRRPINMDDKMEEYRDAIIDMYYDQLRNHEMLSLSRCPPNHFCETLFRH